MFLDQALYPICRWMVPEAFRWYAACEGDDLQQLDDEITREVRQRLAEPVAP